MGGTVDARYAATDGRKVVYSSWNPAKLLRGANKFTYVLLAVLLVLVFLIVLIVRAVARRIKRKQNQK